MTFKLNDRVKIIHTHYDLDHLPCPELAVGETGVVVDVDDDLYFDVKMDSGYSKSGDDTWPFCASELQLIEEE